MQRENNKRVSDKQANRALNQLPGLLEMLDEAVKVIQAKANTEKSQHVIGVAREFLKKYGVSDE